MEGKKSCFFRGLLFGAISGVVVLIVFFYFNFDKFAVYSAPVNEGAVNLGAIFMAQVSYYGEYFHYVGGKDCFDHLKWSPERPSKYSYYCGGDVIKNVTGDDCPPPTVPHGVTETSFTVVAVGNIDGDPECDIWTMNDAKVLKQVKKDM